MARLSSSSRNFHASRAMRSPSRWKTEVVGAELLHAVWVDELVALVVRRHDQAGVETTPDAPMVAAGSSVTSRRSDRGAGTIEC
jgi:hypothetical protein